MVGAPNAMTGMLDTDLSNVEGSAGTGGFWVNETDDITVGIYF